MECPKCGYERQQNDTECPLCGLDYIQDDAQRAEKEALKQRTTERKKEEGPKKQPNSPPSPPDTKVTQRPIGTCPKCDYDRLPQHAECPNCGVIYEKHNDFIASKQADEDTKRQIEQKKLFKEKNRIQKEVEKRIAKEKSKKKNNSVDKSPIKKSDSIESAKKITQESIKKVSSPGNLKKIRIGLAVLVILVVVGFVATHFGSMYIESVRVAKQKEAELQLIKKRKTITDNFNKNRIEIKSHLKSLIAQKKYDTYENEIKKYDIPSLKNELSDTKQYLKETKLFEIAKALPGKEYRKNYNAYTQLIKLNKKNKLYKKKVKYYRAKLANKKYKEAKIYFSKKERLKPELKKAISAINEVCGLEPAVKKYKNLRYKLKKAELLFYEGNDRVQMAVRDDGITKGAVGGQRKLYIWIKNIDSEPFYINLDYFSLTCRNKKTYSYNDCSKQLVVNLQPGKETKGYLYFYTKSRPVKLTFAHINAGTVARIFP